MNGNICAGPVLYSKNKLSEKIDNLIIYIFRKLNTTKYLY